MNKEVTILRTSRKGIEIEVIENEVSGVKWKIDTTEHDKQIRADALEEVLKSIEIGIEATGHYDQYTTGFCNALIWLRSCITSEEPQFLEIVKGEKE